MKHFSFYFAKFARNIFRSDNYSVTKDEATPRKLATATQLQFPRNVADFKQATGFQISRRTLRKLYI
jgi:hypothetical protein